MNGEKRRLGPSVEATFASTDALLSVRVSSAVARACRSSIESCSSGGSPRSMRSPSAAGSRKETRKLRPGGVARRHERVEPRGEVALAVVVGEVDLEVVVGARRGDRLERRRLGVAVAAVGGDHVVARGQAREEVVLDVADRAVVGELEDVERERAAGGQLARRPRAP